MQCWSRVITFKLLSDLCSPSELLTQRWAILRKNPQKTTTKENVTALFSGLTVVETHFTLSLLHYFYKTFYLDWCSSVFIFCKKTVFVLYLRSVPVVSLVTLLCSFPGISVVLHCLKEKIHLIYQPVSMFHFVICDGAVNQINNNKHICGHFL